MLVALHSVLLASLEISSTSGLLPRLALSPVSQRITQARRRRDEHSNMVL